MSEATLPAVIVLGNPDTPVGRFVRDNLREANVTALFAISGDDFSEFALKFDQIRVVLIEPDWDLMFNLGYPQARLFVVSWRGSTWEPPWEDAGFEVRDPYVDDKLFQRHVRAWLREMVEDP